jgi:hypothetical protein
MLDLKFSSGLGLGLGRAGLGLGLGLVVCGLDYNTVLNSQQLDKSIFLPFLPRDRLTPQRFLAAVERVVQSNDQFTWDDSVGVNVVHVEMPQEGTGRNRDVVNLESYLTKKRGIIQIKNKDDLCCARAIIVAKEKLDKDPHYEAIGKPNRAMQPRLARELHESAGVPLGPCGIRKSRSSKLLFLIINST